MGDDDYGVVTTTSDLRYGEGLVRTLDLPEDLRGAQRDLNALLAARAEVLAQQLASAPPRRTWVPSWWPFKWPAKWVVRTHVDPREARQWECLGVGDEGD